MPVRHENRTLTAANETPPHELPDGRQMVRALSDTDLLAQLLGAGSRDLAEELLDRFGSLRGVFSAGFASLRVCRGVGPQRAARLPAALEASRRYYYEQLKLGPALESPEATRRFLLAELRDLRHEVFGCLFLDNRHRVLAFDILFRGTIDGASVHPREVVTEALHRNAAAVILAHNHPSGVAEPSDADCRITIRLRETLALLDIRVLDHLIVGDGVCVSFAERGLL
jgi:DNA repair protein RadC